MTIRIAVQDRQRLFRDGLALLLDSEPDLAIVATAATASELVAAARQGIDVVVLDLDASEWDACRLVAALRKLYPRLLVLGTTEQERTRVSLRRAYQAGVTTVLPRTAGVRTMLQALRSPPGRTVAPLAPVVTIDERRPRLTERESQVLDAIGSGATTREIAAALGISPKTVEKHKYGVFSKLGAVNQAQAVSVALRTGLLDPSPALTVA
jgi:DNA-binding NarL/FixJ family response regulator